MTATTIPRPYLRPARLRPGRLRDLVRGRADDPAWARPALIVLLSATAIAYIWNLTASGDSNSFYAAAVQAGTKSWKAFFFGSIDSSSFITVDKPPASLWVMALSGRIFGFSSASMLAPEVLEGVLAVGLLSATVKRWFGAGAGLLAGAVLALTPVAALMFRFNNPDALLVCLLVASAYCLTRALEGASTRWLVATGALIGFAFLAKMMQAFLVVPGFALVYLGAAPTGLGRRVKQTLAAGAAIAVSAGWWVAIVALWPASSRPRIDGSATNNIFDLILGYNGLGRIFGATAPGGGGGGGANFSGSPGVLRLFNDLMGAQASWLLPAAGVALAGGLWLTRRAPRTDRTRAALLLWGSWLVVSAAVFSLSTGVIHTYYTVALAPAIAALAAIGATGLWRLREHAGARAGLAAAVLLTGAWAILLLERTPSWEPWIAPVVGIAAVAAAVALIARRVVRGAAVLALVAALAGPLAYTAQTLASAHTGSLPSAGPASASDGNGFGGPGGARIGRTGARAGGPGSDSASAALVSALERDASSYRWVAATSGSQSAATLELATGGEPVMAIGGFNNQGGNLTLAQFEKYAKAGEIHYYTASGAAGAGGGGFAGGPPPGTSAGGSTLAGGPPSGSVFGAGGPPGIGGGGFGGAAHARGGFGSGPGGGASTTSITSWVKAHYNSVTIGGQTVYDLTQPIR